jgi:hypothetical protein
MPTHKSSDYKLSAVKYYLSHSKNQVQTYICPILKFQGYKCTFVPF